MKKIAANRNYRLVKKAAEAAPEAAEAAEGDIQSRLLKLEQSLAELWQGQKHSMTWNAEAIKDLSAAVKDLQAKV